MKEIGAASGRDGRFIRSPPLGDGTPDMFKQRQDQKIFSGFAKEPREIFLQVGPFGGVCPIRRFYVGADNVRPYKSCQFS